MQSICGWFLVSARVPDWPAPKPGTKMSPRWVTWKQPPKSAVSNGFWLGYLETNPHICCLRWDPIGLPGTKPPHLLLQMGSGWVTWNQTPTSAVSNGSWLGYLEPNPESTVSNRSWLGYLEPNLQICYLRWVSIGLPRTKPPHLLSQMGPGWVT